MFTLSAKERKLHTVLLHRSLINKGSQRKTGTPDSAVEKLGKNQTTAY
jgi:hypothetical protein